MHDLQVGSFSNYLVVDSDFESGGAPVDELDGPLGLDGGDGRVHVLGDDVTAVEHAASHVLAVTGIALHHLIKQTNKKKLKYGITSRVRELTHKDWQLF
jgi:hypothetical protein